LLDEFSIEVTVVVIVGDTGGRVGVSSQTVALMDFEFKLSQRVCVQLVEVAGRVECDATGFSEDHTEAVQQAALKYLVHLVFLVERVQFVEQLNDETQEHKL